MHSIVPSQCFCGEAPITNPKTGLISWVDTGNPLVWQFDPVNGVSDQISSGELFQSLGLASEGRWIAPLEKRLVICDENLYITDDLGNPTSHKPYLVLGDGTAGPDGCYYYTVYHPLELGSKEGSVLRVNRDHSVEMVVTDLALPNGMAFSGDGKSVYVTEMFGNCIWKYDFNAAEGQFSHKERFASIPEKEGYPDGLILDSRGNVLSAHWQGFRITRYKENGAVDMIIPVPVPTATCMAFGGPDLRTLYVTTARKGCTEEQLSLYPESGNLFMLEMDIPGVYERRFMG